MRVDVPVSVGELLDKITILRIEAQQIRFDDRRAALERTINERSGSSLVEEKSYDQTPSPP